ncbi:MAG TPA: DUF2007 domain-containing protein [Acidobacteriaceae bacterium]|jgi:hypothetical protein|nr:DUF2007 domain-containing protein [Acidobacteriaceae bacterium]
MADVVTIASFTEPMEAEMARLRLESAGIEVFLSGENARIMEPGLGPLQMQVSSDDEADARAILADPGADPLPGDDPDLGSDSGPASGEPPQVS